MGIVGQKYFDVKRSPWLGKLPDGGVQRKFMTCPEILSENCGGQYSSHRDISTGMSVSDAGLFCYLSSNKGH